MPTDAPDGNINAHVVRGRRSDHVTAKAARQRPPHEKAPEPKAEEVVAEPAEAPKTTTKGTKKG